MSFQLKFEIVTDVVNVVSFTLFFDAISLSFVPHFFYHKYVNIDCLYIKWS